MKTKTVYVIVKNALEYDDQYYSTQGGYDNVKAFKDKQEAEEEAKRLDIEERKHYEVSEFYSLEGEDSFPDYFFFRVVPLEYTK